MSRRYDFPKDFTLKGGFNCEISNAEANQWHEFVLVHRLGIRYSQIVDELAYLRFAIEGGDLSPETKKRFEDLCRECEIVYTGLYELGKAWYAELTMSEKREPVEAA